MEGTDALKAIVFGVPLFFIGMVFLLYSGNVFNSYASFPGVTSTEFTYLFSAMTVGVILALLYVVVKNA